MSSRRKSRPVRRLDMICSMLQESGGVMAPPSWTEQDAGADEDAVGSPETADDVTHTSDSPVSEIAEDHPADILTGEAEPDIRRHSLAPRPPEGVYVLQPESVSDDEESQEKKAQESAKNSEGRKRSYEHDDDNIAGTAAEHVSKSNEPYSGLDLSVKRPRIDGTSSSEGDFEKANNTTPLVQSASPNLFMEGADHTPGNVSEQLEKYHQLMRLVAQQKPLTQAMEEVGLNVHDFFALHRLNSQLIATKLDKHERPYTDEQQVTSAPPTLASTFEKFSSKGQPLPVNLPLHSEEWTAGQARHDAKIQNLLKEAKEDVIQQQKQSTEAQQLNNSRLQQQPTTLNPSMAAALMASLSNPDQSSDEQRDALRKIFLKAQGVFAQNSTPVKSVDSFNSATNSPSVLDRSNASKNDSITAGTVSSGVGSIKRGTLDPANFDEDVFDQYIAKFTNMNRCGLLTCQYYTRDHYHCVVEDCNYQRFTNKADVIRHYNMHKKRDNSLAHGFLRFSPTEDCSSKYPNCHLNGKSTHYHCMQPDCNKVYTSTSDVMTHENFHKKYMQFVCSGFKRFRATEQCDLPTCSFRNQKTTHFHCTRGDCNFTFKNKCDIEKHKTYHLRDDQYISKGFKKFYKNETCGSNECVWNYTANHFHCLRQGCSFSFTSTSQMESHKRKHDRNEYLGEDNSLNGSSQNSPKLPMFNPAVFQEAAKKILASMPAAALPHIIGASTPSSQLLPKTETTQYASASRSEPVSPTTPLTGRSYHNYDALQTTKEKPKEESAWNGTYGDTQMSSASFHAPAAGGSPAPSTQRSTSLMEGSHSDWPRTSSLISPSMAISAAAALKPNATATDSSAGDNVPDREYRSTALPGTEEKLTSEAHVDCKSNIISKYFKSAEPLECWIPECEFSSKRHFHCLVVNCEAMFTSEDNVIKHAKFHENLELMGASIPIQNINVSTKQPVTPKSSNEADPPPGYIALQSRMVKPHLTEYMESQRPMEVSGSSPDRKTSEEQNGGSGIVVSEQTSDAMFLQNGLTLSQGRVPSLASQIYANALLKGSVTDSTDTPLSSTPVSAYRLMQNSASLSALMARMAQSTPRQVPSENNVMTPGESELQGQVFGSKKDDLGYVHIKTGMPCLRHDCKYAHQNHWHCTINRCRYVCKSIGKAQTHRQAHDSLDAYARSAKECFKSYSVKKQCPNLNCEFRLRGHYHCLKPGCTFATIGTSKLPWHMKKHEKIARREASGFKYYTKKEHCNHHNCKYNGNFSHYHCVRKGCTFAFQYKHQMSTHVRKHIRRMLGRTYATGEDVQDIDHTNVDSGDDSLPLIIDEVEEAEQRPGPSSMEEQTGREQLSQQQMDVLERMTKQMKSSYGAVHQGLISDNENADGDRPAGQISGALDNEENSDDSRNGHYRALDLSSLAAGSSKSNDSSAQQQAQDLESMNEDSMSNGMGNSTDEAETNLGPENDEGMATSHSPVMKSSPGTGQFNKFKIGDGILEGFRRFETNENCGDGRCTYMYKVSHYHCTRDSCNYRFTGRSHMFKHQQHHDRVAGLVRDDFKRFKASHPCEDEQCEYRGKNTHFHCLRCAFKCTDSAKVGTHRRQHMKADALEQSGFQRVRGKDDCGREDCKYRFRNMSHFHCLQPGCNYTIVGLTGIELHAEKHKRGLLQSTTSRHAENTNLIMQNLAAFRSMQQQMLGTSMVQSNPEDIGMAHNLSLQTLAAFRDMQNQATANVPPTPTSPAAQSENGHSNQSSPFLMQPQGEPGHLLSRFAFLSSSNATQAPMAAPSSPVTSTSMSIVTEGVGS